MANLFYPSTWILEHFQQGPLLPTHIDKFAALLSGQGYATLVGKQKIRLLANLNRWLERRRLKITDFNEKRVSQYWKYRRRKGYIDRQEVTTLHQFLQCLRDEDIIPEAVPVKIKDGLRDRIAKDYKQYLLQERGLSQPTIINYLPIIRRFLNYCFGKKTISWNKIRVDDISRFILRHADTVSRGRAKLMVTAIRSFLGFLRLRGDIQTDLALSVPCVVKWRLTSLPKSLSPQEVQQLLKSCDQSDPAGRRDYALLLLLARLGLRAGEIAAMTLDDINWDAGELTIRGKGSRRDVLPLPEDVGQALANYLYYGRPACSTRRVFICMHAPHRGFTGSQAVCTIVRRALARANLHPDCQGAHLLRHSLANRMLQKGASLMEIGEILRHQSMHTTEIYTKVDIKGLRSLAQPWPIKEDSYEQTT